MVNSQGWSPLWYSDDPEALSIKATRLNAFKLKALGAVQIRWTQNLSRHMLLTICAGRNVLEIFQLPCAFYAETMGLNSVGIPVDLLHEIRESYSILFNAWAQKPPHVRFGLFLGLWKWCWCWACSAYGYRHAMIQDYQRQAGLGLRTRKNATELTRSEFDPVLVNLMEKDGSRGWTNELFPNLWMRIMALEEHLETSKPWSIWILFRDRRDTVQFWTFL